MENPRSAVILSKIHERLDIVTATLLSIKHYITFASMWRHCTIVRICELDITSRYPALFVSITRYKRDLLPGDYYVSTSPLIFNHPFYLFLQPGDVKGLRDTGDSCPLRELPGIGADHVSGDEDDPLLQGRGCLTQLIEKLGTA